MDPNDHSTDPGLPDLFADGVTFAPGINLPARAGGAGRLREELDPDGSRKHWFAYFRFYRPTEPYFDRSWPLPDRATIERVSPNGQGFEKVSGDRQ